MKESTKVHGIKTKTLILKKSCSVTTELNWAVTIAFFISSKSYFIKSRHTTHSHRSWNLNRLHVHYSFFQATPYFILPTMDGSMFSCGFIGIFFNCRLQTMSLFLKIFHYTIQNLRNTHILPIQSSLQTVWLYCFWLVYMKRNFFLHNVPFKKFISLFSPIFYSSVMKRCTFHFPHELSVMFREVINCW
jgi:hypothetical protein